MLVIWVHNAVRVDPAPPVFNRAEVASEADIELDFVTITKWAATEVTHRVCWNRPAPVSSSGKVGARGFGI
ncbi:hypothetical protein MMCCUG48898_1669 [Mycobacteroides abscessus subsp. massiliense CCUG 48898 = JCM 15300]|nr:hypothetical protein MMCCUG48898_1669 [Mycobacteroides abscessus subsp. massiliense CCUG 48898 = JCM 15300]